jgi:hypothetical protein
MTANTSIDPAEFLHEHLTQASPDLLRELMQGSSTPCSPRTPTASAVPPTAPGTPAARTVATGTDTLTLAPGSALWMWRSRSCDPDSERV